MSGSHGPIAPSSSTSGFADSTLSTFPFELGVLLPSVVPLPVEPDWFPPDSPVAPVEPEVSVDDDSAIYFIGYECAIYAKFTKVHITPKINVFFTIFPPFFNILIFNGYY